MAAERSRRERVEQGIYFRHDATGPTVKLTVYGDDGKPARDADGKLAPKRTVRGRFVIGYRDATGKQRWRTVEGTSIEKARAARDAATTRRRSGERESHDPRLTFNAAADKWWSARVVPRQRDGTADVYGRHLRLHVRPAFGTVRLDHITPTDVTEFITAQEAAGCAPWSIRGHLTVLSAVFTYAARHLGYKGRNPVAALDKDERPAKPDPTERVLSGDELRRLIAAVEQPHRLLFSFAGQTGARLGEVLGVTWGDVDLDAGTVRFTHQLSRKGVRVPVKTARSRRTIEIAPTLAGDLRAAKLAAVDSGADALVFVTSRQTPHDHRNIGGRVLARAVKRAAIDPPPTFHDFRRTHGSALIAQGWDLEEVSRRLGHTDVATTARAYVHAYEAAQRSSVRQHRLAELYENPATPTTGEVVPIREAR